MGFFEENSGYENENNPTQNKNLLPNPTIIITLRFIAATHPEVACQTKSNTNLKKTTVEPGCCIFGRKNLSETRVCN